MKYLSVLLLTSLIVTGTHAAKTGVGVSVDEDSGTIYLPIEVSNHFRVEPTFSFYYFEDEYEDGRKSAQTSMALNVGLFGKTTIIDQLSTYYGARVGYTYTQRKYWINRLSNYDSSTHGINLDPTLGLEFFITERFSIGGEVSCFVRYSLGEESGSTETQKKEIRTGTGAKLIARFYF